MWSPEEGGDHGVVDVAWERREEKRALVPFVSKRLTRGEKKGGKGGVRFGMRHGGGGGGGHAK
jgi:hypothetical protein